jgi:hypothetical protein
MLTCCGLDERAAYFANLPAFLSKKHTYTDMFTHSLSHLPDMLEVVGHVFTLLEEQGQDVKKVSPLLEPAIQHLKEDLKDSSNSMEYYYYSKKLFFYEQILSYHKDILSQYDQLGGGSISPFSSFYKDNLEALFLSFVSYIYFDLWVTPRQLFFPEGATCSGSWELWEEVDYFKLAQWFAKDTFDESFIDDAFQKGRCKEQLVGSALIKAMIVRMGEKGSPPIQYSVIDWNIRMFFRFLGIKGYKRFDAEMEYLLQRESEVQGLLKSKFEKQ